MGDYTDTYKWQDALGCMCKIKDRSIRDSLRQLILDTYSKEDKLKSMSIEIKSRFNLSIESLSTVFTDEMESDCAIYTLVGFLIEHSIEEHAFDLGFNEDNYFSLQRLHSYLKDNGASNKISIVTSIFSCIVTKDYIYDNEFKSAVIKCTAEIIEAMYHKNLKIRKENEI